MDLTLSRRAARPSARWPPTSSTARSRPHAAEWDRAEAVDRGDRQASSATLGFLGLTIPEEHGGSGGDHLAYCLVLEELGRGDSSVRGIVSVSLGLVAKTIAALRHARAAGAWLPAAVRRRGARLLRA